MPTFPRIAVGTVQPRADSRLICWGLMAALAKSGRQVQHFLSRACFLPCDGAITATGANSRHLDSWLMTREVCHAIFARAARSAAVSVIEGTYAAPDNGFAAGGTLDALCQWLDLPQLAVIDIAELNGCRLPERPDAADALLLDRIPNQAEFHRYKTVLESLWGIPVLGGLTELPQLRAAVNQLGGGASIPKEVCEALSADFRQLTNLEAIAGIAQRRELAPLLPAGPAPAGRTRVAVAFDAAFHCYFPDTLELLESRGVTVVDFSPLRDESLPPDIDIVYLGCGHPEKFADELAENHCMASALRNHVCAGRRMYAEGGGLAYLCQYLEAEGCGRRPMCGVLPALANLNPSPAPPRPIELSLASSTWIGAASKPVRGYLNSMWALTPSAQLSPLVAEPAHQWDLVGRRQAIGSRLHLNFAAQPNLFERFLEPQPACARA